ncbi:hypothetical protein AQUCO_00100581v1 [Aquilegia coerulea]|uniref:Uncharacterized protein n=1 Tax=Aquilegia coerulea TaxID=218851 RepID=A0A2G5FB01_AQUCA|nr:hypothetical protein AQUCO_00100581v1 [Aquilegia coerulea]
MACWFSVKLVRDGSWLLLALKYKRKEKQLLSVSISCSIFGSSYPHLLIGILSFVLMAFCFCFGPFPVNQTCTVVLIVGVG